MSSRHDDWQTRSHERWHRDEPIHEILSDIRDTSRATADTTRQCADAIAAARANLRRAGWIAAWLALALGQLGLAPTAEIIKALITAK